MSQFHTEISYLSQIKILVAWPLRVEIRYSGPLLLEVAEVSTIYILSVNPQLTKN